MSVFKNSKHLASWAGVSPGNYESAGKKTGKTQYGNKSLRTTAVECSMATDRQYNRIAAHRKRIMKRQGKSKARIARSFNPNNCLMNNKSTYI